MIRYIADRLGFISKREASLREYQTKTASYLKGTVDGAFNALRERGETVQAEVRRVAGEIEAERNGYKAQWEQAERRLRVANGLLQRAGKMPVTSFV